MLMELKRETISSKIKIKRSLGVLILHLMINQQPEIGAALEEEVEIEVVEDQIVEAEVALGVQIVVVSEVVIEVVLEVATEVDIEVVIEAVEVEAATVANLITILTQPKTVTSKLLNKTRQNLR
jgi:hypothetical protein